MTVDASFPDQDIVEGMPTTMGVVADDWVTDGVTVAVEPALPGAACSDWPFAASGGVFEGSGPLSATTAVVFDAPGTWLVCSWGQHLFSWSVDTTLVEVRPRARASPCAVRRVRAGRTAGYRLDYDVEVPRRLIYAAVRGATCGRGTDAARASRARVRLADPQAAGAGGVRIAVRFPTAGRWRLCAYAQRADRHAEANAVAGLAVRVTSRRAAGPRPRRPPRGPRPEFG